MLPSRWSIRSRVFLLVAAGGCSINGVAFTALAGDFLANDGVAIVVHQPRRKLDSDIKRWQHKWSSEEDCQWHHGLGVSERMDCGGGH